MAYSKIKNGYDLVYKTSTTPFFPICLIGQNYSRNFGRLCGVSKGLQEPLIVTVIDGTVSWFFPKSLARIGKEAFTNYLCDRQCLRQTKRKERTISRQLLQEIKEPFHKVTSKKLQRIFSAYAEYGYFVDVAGYLFQLYYLEEFKSDVFYALKKYPLDEKERMFTLLLSSHTKTNYEKFLFALGKSRNLQRIEKKFFWLIHDYLGEVVDKKYIRKQIMQHTKNPDKLRHELRETNLRIAEIKRIARLLPKRLQKQLAVVQDLVYLYNERKKEVLNQVNIYLRRVFEQRLQIKKISKLHAYYQLTPDEMFCLFDGRILPDVAVRERTWVYRIDDGRIETGSRAYLGLSAVHEKTKVLKGIPAAPGKVRGRVALILNISQIQRFEGGRILVAPFTNVNYLPIMRRAKAVLTETGGLTSHGAVVSRELKKPCIVGIKNLLLVLKDGDFIEVDAARGVVKIIKKA